MPNQNLTVQAKAVDSAAGQGVSLGPTNATSVASGNVANTTLISQIVAAAGSITRTIGTAVVEAFSWGGGAFNSQSTAVGNAASNVARTTDAVTTTTILTLAVPAGKTLNLLVWMVAGRDAVAGTVGDLYTAHSGAIPQCYSNVGGVVHAAAVNGAQTNAHDASMATCAVAVTISGTNLIFTVNGLAGVTIDWTATALYMLV